MCLLVGEADEGRVAQVYFKWDGTEHFSGISAFSDTSQVFEYYPELKEQLGVKLLPAFIRLWKTCSENHSGLKLSEEDSDY